MTLGQMAGRCLKVGNSTVSRMEPAPVRSITRRSTPDAEPAGGRQTALERRCPRPARRVQRPVSAGHRRAPPARRTRAVRCSQDLSRTRLARRSGGGHRQRASEMSRLVDRQQIVEALLGES